ncbi:hypothetical protein E2C01_010822 [Portunus trituberculatus]|uniref:Uncharacterized protein n=1 Tax=Portunus trituberculatus TaxID=210409 RepID=A0A5B7D9F9_PORTR|nr:hypothetical protein [Portunus trituberculatus]
MRSNSKFTITTKHVYTLTVMAAGGKRLRFTITYKLQIIDYTKKHVNRAAARAFGPPPKQATKDKQGKVNITFVAQFHIDQNLRITKMWMIMPLADVFFPNSFKALLEAGTGTFNSHSRNYLLGLDGNVFLARVTPSLSYILGPHRYGAFLFLAGPQQSICHAIAISSVSKAELFAQTLAKNSTMDNASPSPTPSVMGYGKEKFR